MVPIVEDNGKNNPFSEKNHRALVVSMCLALFVMGLDMGVVNVILPELQTVFDTTVSRTMMVATVYFMIMAAFQLFFGRCSDVVNPVAVFLAGVIFFFLGSLICVVSQTIFQIIAGRAVQGFGGAMLGASFGAIILHLRAREQIGGLLGMMVMVMSLGSIIGPPLGGFLTQRFSWHWVFAINLPICLLAAIPLVWMLKLRERKPGQGLAAFMQRIDPVGAVLSVFMFASLPMAFSTAASSGWKSLPVLLFLLAFVLSAALFVFWEKRVSVALIRLDILTNSRVLMVIGIKVFVLMIINGVMLIYPFFMVQGLGFSVGRTGIMMLACAGVMAVLTPVTGRLSDRLGPVRVMGAGGLIMLVVSLGVLFFDAQAGLPLVFFSLAGFGVAFAGMTISSTVQLLRFAARGEEGVFSGLNSLLTPVSGSLGLAVFSFIYAMGAKSAETDAGRALAGFQAGIIGIVSCAGCIVLMLCLLRFAREKTQTVEITGRNRVPQSRSTDISQSEGKRHV